MTDDPNWSWRKGRDKKGKAPKRDGYSEGNDPLERAGKETACEGCPAALVCLTMPAERGDKNWHSRGRVNGPGMHAHLHWCPMCKHNYFEVNGSGSVGAGKSTDELVVDAKCPTLLDFEDKQKHSVVCWKCRHQYKLDSSGGVRM